MKFYTGIGSRQTPDHILKLMTRVAVRLNELGYTLRSGGATGADLAFQGELSASDTEIYIPWKSFNNSTSPRHVISPAALAMAAQFHPAWHRCSAGGRKLHARNCYQILGSNLHTPSEFVLCWTPNGKPVGGTAQAMRIAEHYSIPIINFHNPDPLERITQLLK